MSSKGVGIFIGDEQIGSLTPCEIEYENEYYIPEYYSLEMTYYMRRKNKVFLRNDSGQKLNFQVSELPKDILEMKYGTKLICNFTLE